MQTGEMLWIKRDLLFLNYLGHFMIESHLLVFAELLPPTEEHHPALVVATVDSLYEPATFQNGVVVPLDLEHPPVLLNVDCGLALLLPPLLGLTNMLLV